MPARAAPILALAASRAGLSIKAASIDPTVGGGAPNVSSGGSCLERTGGKFKCACCWAATAAAESSCCCWYWKGWLECCWLWLWLCCLSGGCRPGVRTSCCCKEEEEAAAAAFFGALSFFGFGVCWDLRSPPSSLPPSSPPFLPPRSCLGALAASDARLSGVAMLSTSSGKLHLAAGPRMARAAAS